MSIKLKIENLSVYSDHGLVFTLWCEHDITDKHVWYYIYILSELGLIKYTKYYFI